MSAEDDLGREPDRFDLEQAIMACWTTSDDIELAANYVSDLTETIGAAAADKIVNLLAGLKELHDLRCNKVLDIFTEMVERGDIREPE